jgi:hypothetical protein
MCEQGMAASEEHRDPTAGAAILPQDGRQSEAALAIARGAGRCLLRHGMARLTEVPLPNGRRADLVGLKDTGEIWIVEVKSSMEDFRADQKWPEYLDYCDRLLFAVAPGFPVEILPDDAGLLIADRYGGELIKGGPEHKLAAARRKVMLTLLARTGALRLHALADPDMGNAT